MSRFYVASIMRRLVSVLTHCVRTVIGDLNPDGMLACLLHEVDPGKESIRL